MQNSNIINTTNINEARKQIEKLKKQNPNEKIAILSQDDEFNRKALEIKNLDIFILNENLELKDYSKQRNSQLNEVLVKLAKQKNIKIAIQIQEIIKKSDKEKARALSRLIQNLELCKKAGTKLVFLNQNNESTPLDKRDLQTLFLVLGADTKQALEATSQY